MILPLVITLMNENHRLMIILSLTGRFFHIRGKNLLPYSGELAPSRGCAYESVWRAAAQNSQAILEKPLYASAD